MAFDSLAAWNMGSFVATTMMLPILIGVYYLVRRPSQSSQEFIFGKYELHFFIVGISLSAFASAPFILLLPVEMVFSGTTWLVALAALAIAASAVAAFHVPPLHYSRSTSLFQYLEDRYRSKWLRYLTLFWHILTNLCYCTIILTLSSLLAAKLVQIDKWICSACLALITLVACVGGGQKAAVNLSVLSYCCLSVVSLLCIAVAGILNEKSWTSLTTSNVNGTSPLVPNYLPSSPYDDANVYLIFAASLVFFLTFFGSNQIAHQHYCSLQTKKRARLAILVCFIGFTLTWFLCCATGLLLWQFYVDSCASHPTRPVPSSTVDILSQFYVEAVSAKTPGVYGFLMGALVVLTYNTLPVGLTSLAACTWEDLVKLYCVNAKERWHVTILRLLCVLYAALISLVSFAILETVVDVWMYLKNALIVLSSLTAPMGALFLLAVWLPCSNKKGIFVGLFLGIASSISLAVGHLYFYRQSYSTSASQRNLLCCNVDIGLGNFSVLNGTLPQVERNALCIDAEVHTLDAVFPLFKLPLLLHPLISFFLTFLFGAACSFATGGQDIYALDWNLVYFTCNELTAKCQCCKSASKRRRKRSRLATAYATSDSFRYSRQGPFPDNSYHNPNVQTYLDTLSKKV